MISPSSGEPSNSAVRVTCRGWGGRCYKGRECVCACVCVCRCVILCGCVRSWVAVGVTEGSQLGL